MNTRRNVTLIAASLSLALVVSLPSIAAANLLVDPDFNGVPPLNTMAGIFGPPFVTGQWGPESGGIIGPVGVITPLSAPTMHVMSYNSSGYTQTAQITDVSSYPSGSSFNLSAFFTADANVAAANAFVNISFYDASYANLPSPLSTGLVLDSSAATWEPISMTAAAPPSTKYVVSQVLFLESSLLDSQGVIGRGYVDSASLTVVPEPSAFVLCGAAVVGLLVYARRRKNKIA